MYPAVDDPPEDARTRRRPEKKATTAAARCRRCGCCPAWLCEDAKTHGVQCTDFATGAAQEIEVTGCRCTTTRRRP